MKEQLIQDLQIETPRRQKSEIHILARDKTLASNEMQ